MCILYNPLAHIEIDQPVVFGGVLHVSRLCTNRAMCKGRGVMRIAASPSTTVFPRHANQQEKPNDSANSSRSVQEGLGRKFASEQLPLASICSTFWGAEGPSSVCVCVCVSCCVFLDFPPCSSSANEPVSQTTQVGCEIDCMPRRRRKSHCYRSRSRRRGEGGSVRLALRQRTSAL